MLKRRKNKEVAETIATLEKQLDAFNYSPVAYINSDEYDAITIDRDGWAARETKGIPINELSDDIIDPKIEALERLEISRAQQQYVRHIATIKHIREICAGQLARAQSILEALERDRTEYIAKKEKLYKLRNSQGGIHHESDESEKQT